MKLIKNMQRKHNPMNKFISKTSFSLLLLLILPAIIVAQDTIYFENFSGQSGKGYVGSTGWDTAGTSNSWTIDVTGHGMNNSADDYFYVHTSDIDFAGRDVDGEVEWFSIVADISGHTDCDILIDVPADDGNMESADYIRLYYKLDGGAETLLTGGNINNDHNSASQATASNLNGSTLQIIVKVLCDGGTEAWHFDNVLITGDLPGSNYRYAIADGDWDQTGTWSYTDGGASCSCIPNDSSIVYISDAYSVAFDSDGSAAKLFVEGELYWDSGDDELTIYGDTLQVFDGGSIDESAQLNAAIIFAGSTKVIINDATYGIDIDDIQVLESGYTYPLNESFESSWLPTDWVKYSPDGGSGWEQITVGTSPPPGWGGGTATATPDGNGGSEMAYATWTTGGATANDQWLVTPRVTNISASDSLTFWMRKFAGYYDRVDIKVSTTNYLQASFTAYLDSIELQAVDNGWFYYAYSLSAYAGQDIYIAFNEWVADNWNDGDAIFIDQVKVKRDDTVKVDFSGSGRLYVTDDILIYSGSSVTNNMTDTIRVVDDFRFEGDNASFVNNGLIKISDDINLQSGSNNIITNNAGYYLYIAQKVEGINIVNAVFHNYGTITIGQDLEDSDVGSNASSFYNYTNATLNLRHDNAGDMNWKIYASYSGNTVNYNDNGNQPIFDPEDSYYHLTLSNSSTKTALDNLVINGNLLITDAAVLDVDNYNISLDSNWTNNSTDTDPFVQGTQTVTLSGSFDQTFTNGNDETFYNLVINKPGGDVYLHGPSQTNIVIESAGSLTLTDGIIYTGDNYHVYFEDNATIAGGSAISHIDGPVTKIGNDPFAFPVGDEGFYAPMDITDPVNIDDSLTAQYLNSTPPDTASIGSGIHHISKMEYWLLDLSDVSISVGVTLNWTTGNISGVSDIADLVFVYYDPGMLSWEVESSSASGDALAGDIGIASLPSIGGTEFKMTLGSAGNKNPLPIELLEFNAWAEQNLVKIKWITASEINNDYFTIEKTIDGLFFETIAIIDGAGNSNILIDYNCIDYNPYLGLSYYRLKQTDYDGKYEYSELIPIVFEDQIDLEIISIEQIDDNRLRIILKSKACNSFLVNVFNIEGQLLNATKNVEILEGINTLLLNIGNISAGLYIISVQSNSDRISVKTFLY
ncbi:choice-of-anchor J domain-containing protein [candidate division KSB1 bacterium]